MTYRLVSPPAGASIDATTGEISWTPPSTLASTSQVITVEASENGIVANSATTDFTVTIAGDNLQEFFSWSGGQPAWSEFAGGDSYNLGANFAYLGGADPFVPIFRQLSGTVPQWATVTVSVKIADFNATWAQGGEIEFGFYDGQPVASAPDAAFLASGIADVPNYNGDALVDGLGNTGGDVDYFFNFQTDEEITDPWLALRKNYNGGRVGVDDVVVSYYFEDQDEDGLPRSTRSRIGHRSSASGFRW